MSESFASMDDRGVPEISAEEEAALPMPVGPDLRTLDVVEEELTGANLSLWEEEQTTARLRLALESAKRGRRELRARVAELERPAIEALRGEIQLSYRQLAAQAREDRDYEGEATVLQRLEEREQQWKRDDEQAAS